MLRPGSNHTKLAIATLPGYGAPVARTHIGLRTAYENAGAEGSVVWRIDPEGKAAEEMKALCGELASSLGIVKTNKPDPFAKPKKRPLAKAA